MKYILFALALVTSSLVVAVAVPVDPVEAAVTYSCPAGQQPGIEIQEDIRYCYAKVCPDGQVRGRAANNNNPNKCYEVRSVGTANPTIIYDEKGDVLPLSNAQRGRIQATNSDGMKCPSGSYRGGILSGQDDSKCYTCDAGGCQEIRGQPLVAQHLQACLITDRNCINAQRRAQDDYIKSIENSAPRGFKVPKNEEGLAYSASAVKYCDYYNKMNWMQHYGSKYLGDACKIGYEVGFGKGDICTREYLLGHDATHRPIPTRAGVGLKRHADRLRLSEKNLLISDAIKACRDGWVQYSVDYWYCEGNETCQDSLRMEKSRVINPGPRPTKTNFVDEDGNVIETYNAVATSQNCGSVQTAYFSCGFGRGVQNSTFWQVIQMVLNVIIGLVGITAVGGLVYGAVRYASAGDNASQVEQSKTIIKNVIIGIVLFLAMWAILQYMIPGGIF